MGDLVTKTIVCMFNAISMVSVFKVSGVRLLGAPVRPVVSTGRAADVLDSSGFPEWRLRVDV